MLRETPLSWLVEQWGGQGDGAEAVEGVWDQSVKVLR